jgi:hypothetical protein
VSPVQTLKATTQRATRTLIGVVAVTVDGIKMEEASIIAKTPAHHRIGALRRILFQEMQQAASGGASGLCMTMFKTLMKVML